MLAPRPARLWPPPVDDAGGVSGHHDHHCHGNKVKKVPKLKHCTSLAVCPVLPSWEVVPHAPANPVGEIVLLTW